ncbi:MAG TPA: EamA family transporter [Bacteroidales bacterium]|nr:EamA family transporter [Bacteroidales bacterium]
MEFRIGEMAALFAAICWTVSAVAFEAAGRKVGSVVVNFIRLVMAFILLGSFALLRGEPMLPTDADTFHWKWLLLSGVVGFVIGDFFLFKAFTIIGSRLSMLIMTLVPPIAAFSGWVFLGEKLTWIYLLGMTITMAGIALVIFFRREKNGQQTAGKIPLRGILFAIGGAVGQALGLVLSKHGMGDLDPFAATQIRVIAGIAGFFVITLLLSKTQLVVSTLTQSKPMALMLLGATFGPFLGVTASLMAVQHTATGIASTLMALSPILIIIPTRIFFKQSVSWKELIGAAISVLGVTLFFL